MHDGNIVLASRDTAIVKPGQMYHPQRFYRNRLGLCVWEDFNRRIVAKAEPTKPGERFLVKPYALKYQRSDAEIEPGFKSSHIYSETEVSAVVAGLLVEQPTPTKGVLLRGGGANLFYTKRYIVHVYECPDYHEWVVITWWRRVRMWKRGSRVFVLWPLM